MLPFKDQCFDSVIATGILGAVKMNDREQMMSEAFRVLRRNGNIYLSEFCQNSNPEFKFGYEWDFKFTGEFGDMFIVDWKKRKVLFIAHHFTDEEISALMDTSGFMNITMKKDISRSVIGGRAYTVISAWGCKD